MREDLVEIRKGLLEKAKLLPLCPGIYLMKDHSGNVIYVGKSKALKNRVMSYFQFSERHNVKTEKLVSVIRDFSCIYTQTEAEALILENELIKLHKPKYNIKLKDDKNYPYIRLSTGESYPRLSVTRQRKSGKDKYFGPYSSQSAANIIIDTANALFSLPVCKKRFPADIGKERPCLYYHMGRCTGVCTGKVSPDEYEQRIRQVILFLKEDHKEVAQRLAKEMQVASENMEFERAAKLRDCIRSLEKLGKKQQIVRDPSFEADAFGLYADDLGSCVCQLMIRGGRLIDSRLYHFSSDEIVSPESFTSMAAMLYHADSSVPRQLLFDWRLYDKEDTVCARHLSELSGSKVKLSVPERGDGKRLVELAGENAAEATAHRRAVMEKNASVLEELRSLLSLRALPARVEAIDISNSGDEHITAGIICLLDGKFAKKEYKLFNIRSPHRDDVGAMEEAYSRRLARAKEGDEGFRALPDLILADGGVGQVNAVKNALRSHGLSIPVFGMVKDSFHKTRCLTDGVSEISIAKQAALFHFVWRIQEEVHRFTFSRMDAKRRKTVKTSSLERIAGIGPQKAKALLKQFRSLSAVSLADEEQLSAVEGISPRDAKAIRTYFSQKN